MSAPYFHTKLPPRVTGESMKYLRLAAVIFLLSSTTVCLADSIPTFYITQVTMHMSPNNGSGDNISFVLTGPGVRITGTGGMGCFDWCSGPIPDPNIAGPSMVFISNFDSVTLGGIVYDASSLGFNSLFNTNGGLNGQTLGFVNAFNGNFLEFNLISPTNGSWGLNFAFSPAQNGQDAYYLFTDGEFFAQGQTPEPGTIGLVLTGLAGIAGVAKARGRLH